MQLTPEIKAQLAEQKKQCIFCKIISGEMEGKQVFEDDKVAAYLDIYPAIKGHTILMLKEHYPIMPYIPADEFHHLFGILPKVAGAVKKGMVSTGLNVFIANGGAAGQQSPHFLIHIFPREQGDGFFNFWFNKRKETLEAEQVSMLANNLPIMMNNHFGRNPASWHKGAGERPDYIPKGKVVYEDEKVLCLIPEKGVVKGHFEIYSKEESSNFDNLSEESAAHIFYVASFAATALFEGLGAHATNIIVKSGNSVDNENELMAVHVLARWQEDGLHESLLWQPKQPNYDLKEIQNKIKNKAWNIKYGEKKKEEVSVIETKEPLTISDKKTSSPEDEIKQAIEKAKR